MDEEKTERLDMDFEALPLRIAAAIDAGLVGRALQNLSDKSATKTAPSIKADPTDRDVFGATQRLASALGQILPGFTELASAMRVASNISSAWKGFADAIGPEKLSPEAEKKAEKKRKKFLAAADDMKDIAPHDTTQRMADAAKAQVGAADLAPKKFVPNPDSSGADVVGQASSDPEALANKDARRLAQIDAWEAQNKQLGTRSGPPPAVIGSPFDDAAFGIDADRPPGPSAPPGPAPTPASPPQLSAQTFEQQGAAYMRGTMPQADRAAFEAEVQRQVAEAKATQGPQQPSLPMPPPESAIAAPEPPPEPPTVPPVIPPPAPEPALPELEGPPEPYSRDWQALFAGMPEPGKVSRHWTGEGSEPDWTRSSIGKALKSSSLPDSLGNMPWESPDAETGGGKLSAKRQQKQDEKQAAWLLQSKEQERAWDEKENAEILAMFKETPAPPPAPELPQITPEVAPEVNLPVISEAPSEVVREAALPPYAGNYPGTRTKLASSGENTTDADVLDADWPPTSRRKTMLLDNPEEGLHAMPRKPRLPKGEPPAEQALPAAVQPEAEAGAADPGYIDVKGYRRRRPVKTAPGMEAPALPETGGMEPAAAAFNTPGGDGSNLIAVLVEMKNATLANTKALEEMARAAKMGDPKVGRPGTHKAPSEVASAGDPQTSASRTWMSRKLGGTLE